MSLSKKQKDFLKTIENPKYKKYQKQQFKLQNKFDKFELGEEIIFIDGIFKTDNPKLIAFFNECPMVEKVEENSLTKESLRDITEPKAESLINKEPPKGDNILRNDLLVSENKKRNISIEVFTKDCERWLLQDLDVGTCQGIKNSCVKFRQFELASKFRDKEIQILSKFDREKLHYLVQQGIINLETLYKVESFKLKNDIQEYKDKLESNKPDELFPKEFCVEITEENKEVLELIFREKYKSNNWSLRVKDFLHSDIKFDSLYSSNKAPDNNVNIEIVLTEEFLRYIGKEELIVKTDSTKTSETKPLDFDLPKKENPIQNIECLSINDIIDSGVLIVESPLCQKLKDYLVDLVNYKTNPLNLK